MTDAYAKETRGMTSDDIDVKTEAEQTLEDKYLALVTQALTEIKAKAEMIAQTTPDFETLETGDATDYLWRIAELAEEGIGQWWATR